MRRRLVVALLGAVLVVGCGREPKDATGSYRDSGPAVGDKAPRSASPTTGDQGGSRASGAPSR